MMKKFAMMIAVLSLCACSFVACSDDDDDKDSKKLADGAVCAADADCASNYCNADKKCAKKADIADGAEGGKCLADDKCNDDLVCNADKICEKKADDGDDDDK